MTNPLKSLQHLARKDKAKLYFYYKNNGWTGVFTTSDIILTAEGADFTTMLRKLYKEATKLFDKYAVSQI